MDNDQTTSQRSEMTDLLPSNQDEQLNLLRRVLSIVGSVPVIGTAADLANELLPTAVERQHQRALMTLWRLMNELQDVVSAEAWRLASMKDEFDSAAVRAMRAAEEAGAESKREFIWYGLVNGWVRETGNPERDQFLRVLAKYDLEHFQVLERVQLATSGDSLWLRVQTLVSDTIGGDRHRATAYLQEFDADGLIRLYDQPDHVKSDSRGTQYVDTTRLALWTSRADRLLEFVRAPR